MDTRIIIKERRIQEGKGRRERRRREMKKPRKPGRKPMKKGRKEGSHIEMLRKEKGRS